MIEIIDKHNCCGCSACYVSCPKQCISFDEDEQGFRYPTVDVEKCIECGLCEKVCPVLNQAEITKPIKVYAGINENSRVRMNSSSGGIFSLIAEKVISKGGLVFGARFDKQWNVVHDYTETIDGLDKFQSSKYVQSKIGNAYVLVRDFLKSGRIVLFSGTSCQIAGLKRFLRLEYDNLITIDVVCHGVPSPKIWQSYISQFNTITGISFRDKSDGWKNFNFVLRTRDGVAIKEPFNRNQYIKLFLNNVSLRPSCYKCPAKAGKASADITLADFWGYDLKYTKWLDNKGVSLILCYSEKGFGLLKDVSSLEVADYQYALKYNKPIEHCVQEPHQVQKFWELYFKFGLTTAMKVNKEFDVTFGHRLFEWLKRNILRRLKR